MLIEMQSAMKTMMNTQFSDHMSSESLKDKQEPLLLLPQEELNSKLQQEQENTSGPSSSSSTILPFPPPPCPATSDIAKEEVIGMVTRAHKDTFMYNQEQPKNPSPVVPPPNGERILKCIKQYNSCGEPNHVDTSRTHHYGNEQHFNGQYKGWMQSTHYSNEHNLCFTSSSSMNFTNGFAFKGCNRMPENGFPPNESMNAYSCSTGGRMHLVL